MENKELTEQEMMNQLHEEFTCISNLITCAEENGLLVEVVASYGDARGK